MRVSAINAEREEFCSEIHFQKKNGDGVILFLLDRCTSRYRASEVQEKVTSLFSEANELLGGGSGVKEVKDRFKTLSRVFLVYRRASKMSGCRLFHKIQQSSFVTLTG